MPAGPINKPGLAFMSVLRRPGMQRSSGVDYDAIAELYDSTPHREKSADPELILFLAGCAPAPNLTLLDIACGTGNQQIANRDRKPDLISPTAKNRWQAVVRSYQSIADKLDTGTTALVGSGNISRSQSSHCLRNSASRLGCFFERSPRSRGSYSMSNRYSLSATFRYFQRPRRTAC